MSVVQYQKKRQLNIGLIIFGIIFIYLIATIAMYLTKTRISVYEVREGSILKDTAYTALAMREEKVFYAEESGYVNYYVQNHSKVRSATNVYSLSTNELILDTDAEAENTALTSEQQYSIFMEIQNFCGQFQELRFSDVYQLKGNIEDELQDITNQSRIDILNDMMKNGSIHDTTLYHAAEDGIIVYGVDGLEDLTADSVTPEHLSREAYTNTEFSNNMQIQSGDPIYKLITDEAWTLYMEISKDTYDTLCEKQYVKVRFKKDNETLWANTTFEEKDGKYYAYLQMEHSMIRYADERYLDIELILEDESGLKIPKSAETSKVFYVVPKSYISQGGNSSSEGVLRKTTDEDGNEITEFLVVNIYYENDEVVYLDPNQFHSNDVLLKPDSTETYTLNEKQQLKGVYQVNKGYAVFKQIQILCESDEYYIVEEGNSFGLANYDHIVLDSTGISENDVVF